MLSDSELKATCELTCWAMHNVIRKIGFFDEWFRQGFVSY